MEAVRSLGQVESVSLKRWPHTPSGDERLKRRTDFFFLAGWLFSGSTICFPGYAPFWGGVRNSYCLALGGVNGTLVGIVGITGLSLGFGPRGRGA